MVEATQQQTFNNLASVKALKDHFDQVTSKTHLRDLLVEEERNGQLRVGLKTESEDCIFDFTHAKIDSEGFKALLKVAEEA